MKVDKWRKKSWIFFKPRGRNDSKPPPKAWMMKLLIWSIVICIFAAKSHIVSDYREIKGKFPLIPIPARIDPPWGSSVDSAGGISRQVGMRS